MRVVRRLLLTLVLAVLAAPITVATAPRAVAAGITLSVAPEDANPCAGYSSVTLTATVPGPLAAVDLMIRAPGAGWEDAGLFNHQSGKTYTFELGESSAGTYDYAAVVAAGPSRSTHPRPQLTLTWNDPALTLAQDGSTSEVGTDVTLSVALSCVEGGEVDFAVDGPGADSAPDPVAVSGTAVQASYSSTSGGTDTITASYEVCSEVGDHTCTTFRSTSVQHDWTVSTASIELTAPTTACARSPIALTAVVMGDGSPVADAEVTFAIAGSDGSDLSYTATSDASGSASVSYTRSSEVTDSITATVQVPGASGDPATAEGTVTWDACALVASIEPRDVAYPVGSRASEQVVVTFDGKPAAGAEVTAQAVMSGQPTLHMSGETAADGTVSFVLSRTVPGTDRLEVTVLLNDETASDTTSVVWQATTPSTPPVTSAPTPPSAVPPPPVPVSPPISPPAAAPSSPAYGLPASSPSPLPHRALRPQRTRTVPARPSSPPATTPPSTPPSSPPSSSSPTPPPIHAGILNVADENPLAGASDSASGHGCPAAADVVLTIDDVAVAQTRADPQGRFNATFSAPDLPVGRHQVLARCGNVIMSAPVDYVRSMANGAVGSALPLTTVAVLSVILLLGRGVLKLAGGRP